MAVSTNISGLAPYYDDFNSSGNDNKNYLRIYLSQVLQFKLEN